MKNKKINYAQKFFWVTSLIITFASGFANAAPCENPSETGCNQESSETGSTDETKASESEVQQSEKDLPKTAAEENAGTSPYSFWGYFDGFFSQASRNDKDFKVTQGTLTQVKTTDTQGQQGVLNLYESYIDYGSKTMSNTASYLYKTTSDSLNSVSKSVNDATSYLYKTNSDTVNSVSEAVNDAANQFVKFFSMSTAQPKALEKSDLKHPKKSVPKYYKAKSAAKETRGKHKQHFTGFPSLVALNSDIEK